MQRITRAGIAPALLLVALFAATVSAGAAQSTPPLGFSEIYGSDGQLVGVASFQRVEDGVQITAQFQALPAGPHGFHLHEFGNCGESPFMTAGAHFNPTKREHGLRNPLGPHVGDLPNILVGDDGMATITAVAKYASLAPGETSLFDADGTSIVIHEKADDEVTDSDGQSGGRIACGVLGAGPAHDLEGRPFVTQPIEVQRAFRAAHGPYAAERWALERDVEVIAGRTTQVAGVQATPPPTPQPAADE